MSLIKERKARWKPAVAADIVAYRVRYDNDVDLVTDYTDQVVYEGLPAVDPDGFMRVPLADMGIYGAGTLLGSIGVTSVDSSDNESDFLEITVDGLDVNPPDAPTDGAIE